MQGFVTTDCTLCGSPASESVLSGPDRLLGFPGQFSHVRCLGCGLIRQNPRPVDALSTYYPESYPSYVSSSGMQENLFQRLDRRYGQWKRAAVVQRFRRSGRLLDVGCATGSFMLEMRRSAAWHVTGIEPNRSACIEAQAAGLDVACTTLAEASFEAGSFDVVTMWNVLEHVADPVAELREVWRVLRPGGIVGFSVPVSESLLRRVFGPYWVEWDLPRHMYIFSSATVQRLLSRTGFQLIGTRTPFSEYRVFRMSLENWVRARLGHSRLCGTMDALIRFLPVRAVLILVLGALVRPGAASTVVFVGRKA